MERPSHMLRRLLVGQVRGVFHDSAKGEKPVKASDLALYPPGSVIRRVHGDVTSMMIGGVSALLMQMLHPAALAGIWDHSSFRDDMLGRLRRTARFIAVTTYAERAEAEAAIARVRQVHEHVRGTLADGTAYAASDPWLLAWVHVCEAMSFLDAWIAYGEPFMSLAEQDRYFAETALVARALGADPVPESRAQAVMLMARFRDELAVTERTREVARRVLHQPAPSIALAPAQAMMMQASVALLPGWARRMHGFSVPVMAWPLVRVGAFALAGTMRWAFRGKR
ncbi:oxygenase MpaB family protein [Sphingobium sp. TKS]|uniref:oxygenase MpaB family protein n=1 Tax=Sphingobium sp. TKS TaxID=1315974 RepID=UPI0008360930|nr:oxygenase MpaB family protein [Sphingobium sp. TKS]